MPLIEDILDIAQTPSEALPTSARGKAKLSLMDWMVCGWAGRDEPLAHSLRKLAIREAGAPTATLIGGGKAPARMAALVNGATSHALDFDDTHFAHIGHPSVAVFPAALAMAELKGRSLPEMIEAALIGMEISVRVGLWLGRGHYQIGFHQTATAGAFGATVAAGRLAGLDAMAMQNALGLAATRAAGLKVEFGTMGKPYNAGIAAATGVEVALLCAAGFEANPDALDVQYGFGATHNGAGDIDAALAGLGDEWLFENVSHKFHACCHGLHAALEAARILDIAGPEIAEVTVRTHPRWMSVCNQLSPTTGLGAKFSYRTVLAMTALGYDTAQLDSYSERTCADPKLIALREKVAVREDDTLSETQAHVSVLRRDGVHQEAEHDLLAPLGLSEREHRIRQKAAALLGRDLETSCWNILNNDTAVSVFADCLQK